MSNRLWDLIAKEVSETLSAEEKRELEELQAQQKPIMPFVRYKSRQVGIPDQALLDD